MTKCRGEDKEYTEKRASVDSVEAMKLALKRESSATPAPRDAQNALSQRRILNCNIVVVCRGAFLMCLGLIVGFVFFYLTRENPTTVVTRHNAITVFLEAAQKPAPPAVTASIAATTTTSTTTMVAPTTTTIATTTTTKAATPTTIETTSTTRAPTTTTMTPLTTTRFPVTTTRAPTTNTRAPTTTTMATTTTTMFTTTTARAPATATMPPEFACEPGWNLFYETNACYKVLPREYLTFNGSEDGCKKLGAHLTSIHSYEENLFVFSLVTTGRTLDFYAHDEMCWIGLFHSNGHRTWTDGTSVDYMQWAPGEPNNWLKREDCAMVLPREHLTFKGAEAGCENLGAHLTSIHSYEENLFVFSLVTTGRTLDYYAHDEMCWIGLFHSNGHRTWTDGTSVDYMQWAPGEPNNWLKREDCAMMFVDKLSAVNWYGKSTQENYLQRWNDIPCRTSLKHAVCKKTAENHRL